MALTKYPEGSVRELVAVSFPLMLSSLSLLAMVFVDRVFLAHYSPAAMSAAVTAGTAWWAIVGAMLILASMAEVFVAQYNGAGLEKRIGRPVWQMAWFALATTLIFVPIAIWGGRLIFYESSNFELENSYFFWLNIFGSSWPLVGALAAFLVGRGKTRLVMFLSLAANCANIFLDWLLIYGVEGWFPPMGVVGAAIATTSGNLLQLGVLLAVFLAPQNRVRFGTSRFNLHLREMGRCLKVGGPQATIFFMECIGWAIFYAFIRHSGPVQLFVAGAAQSVIILFFFAAEGVGRGAAAITGNMIGGGRHGEAFGVFRAGLKLHLIFFVIAGLIFVAYPDPFIDLFLYGDFAKLLEAGGQQLDPALIAFQEHQMIHVLRVTLRVCLFYLLFEGVRWLISGILASAGDTLFLLLAGCLTVPFALLLPAYLFIELWNVGVVGAFTISVFYVVSTASIFYWRFIGCKWQKRSLIDAETEVAD